MSVPAISGLQSQAVGKMYTSHTTQQGGEKFTLTETGRNAELKRLEKQLEAGEITQGEYDQKEAAIKSAPRIVFVDNENITHEGLLSAENAEKEQTKEIDKLRQQYQTGQISQFAYNANMYLMTNPITGNNEPTIGQKLSVLA